MDVGRFYRRNRRIILWDSLIWSLDGYIILGISFYGVVRCWLSEMVVTVFVERGW